MNEDHKPQDSRPRGDGSNGRRGGRGRGRRSGNRKREIHVPQVSPEAIARLQLPLDEGQYIVFDIETTGGNPEKNGITEIFAIRYRGGEAQETFYSLVNPGIPIPPIVRRMTGIDNKMVRNAPRIDEVMPDFVKFVGDDVFVSHNTIGDMKFVRYFAKQVLDLDMENFYLCTHLLVEKLAPEAPDKSLKGLAEYFKLAKGELHRAEADAYVTLDLFKVLIGRLKQRSVRRIDEAVRMQGDLESGLRLGWGVSEKSLDVPPGPGVFYLFDHERQTIFLSSALHLDQEVAKLRSLHQLPRQLLRLVLKSYDLQVQRSSNSFAALLDECDALAKTPIPFGPVNWHQRSVQALFIVENDDGLRLDIGPLEAGTKYAFGPVRDRRLAGELLEQVGAAYNVKCGRHGLLLPKDTETTLLALFAGRLEAELQAVLRRRRALKLWFKPKERQDLSRQAQVLKHLASLKVPPRLTPLLDRSGILVMPDVKDGSWQVYSIVGSKPVGVTQLTGEPERSLRQTGVGSRLQGEIGQATQALRPAPLSSLEANQANATLWWFYNSRGEGKFIPLQDMNFSN